MVEKDTLFPWKREWAPPIPGVMMGLFQDLRVFSSYDLDPFQGPRWKKSRGLAQVRSHPTHYANSLVSNTVYRKQDSPTQEEATYF